MPFSLYTKLCKQITLYLMIEDFQDSFSNYTQEPQKERDNSRSFAMFVLVFAIWVVFAGVFVLVSLPKIRMTLQTTDAVEVYRNREEYKRNSDTVEAQLFFVNASDSVPVIQSSVARVKMTGESTFHDAIEGLLMGPSDEALKQGAISFIAKGTKLIGISVSNGIAFVNFSDEFALSAAEWGSEGMVFAKAQVTSTIKAVDNSIKSVIILVNGSEI